MSIVDRIAAFVAAADHPSEAFENLALEAFRYQFERVAPYRAMCERTGRTPASVGGWTEVPLVPAAAFATSRLATDPPRETFRSSGTLGSSRSVHLHPFPELYRAVVDATFPAACLPAGDRVPILSLIPPREVVPDSSLGFLAAHVVERFGTQESAYGIGARGIEVGVCRSWLSGRQRSGRPSLVLTTALALDDLLERMARMNLHFRLPPGSVVFETGGTKGRARATTRAEILDATERWLAVPASSVISEFGMTELTSHAYARAQVSEPAAPPLFVPPPWLRVRTLDPVSLEELPEGRPGLLAFFDLANVGSALHVLTEDLGSVEGNGFRLSGRASEAELRGCSLTAEELSA